MASEINIDDIPSASAPSRSSAQEIDISQIPAAVNIDDIPSAAPKMKTGMEPGTYPIADAASKALAYPGNVATASVLSILKRLSSEGQEGLKDGGDVMAALKGHGKSGPEILQDSFNMGSVPSYLVGLPLEAAVDPLTHISRLAGLSKSQKLQDIVGKLEKFARPVADKMEDAGRGLYRNVFRKVDADAAKFKGANKVGEHPFSDLAYDKGFLKGGQSPLEMEEATANYRDNVLGPQYNEIVDSPAVSAQRGDLTGSISQGTKDFLRDAASRSLDRPGAMAVANTINTDAKIASSPLGRQIFDKGKRSPRQLLDLAKSYADTARGTQGLPGDIMKKGANASSYKEGLMSFAQDLREKVQQLAEQALPGSRDKIQDLNRQYQVLKSAAKPMLNASMVEARKLPVTQADSVLGGLSLLEAVHGDPTAGVMFGFKRLAKALNAPSAGVRVGNTLKTASKTNAWDAMLRRGILDNANEQEQ